MVGRGLGLQTTQTNEPARIRLQIARIASSPCVAVPRPFISRDGASEREALGDYRHSFISQTLTEGPATRLALRVTDAAPAPGLRRVTRSWCPAPGCPRPAQTCGPRPPAAAPPGSLRGRECGRWGRTLLRPGWRRCRRGRRRFPSR